ncbi:unnamed protein product [Vitrella brassicaformis CCMP3155]|uniref:Uncharacterized protein n=1 Tax=Vitrella brassicaformis (strain CCMP3155) TaxID=1169540 RepID=A0A0G4EDM4_VITBC|nr:unnamed protein product [Vitrella brassicaformis CCMP3155]|eukprot:CEL93470.1 unnamed protein product [Vitrella brassicaformis CCMP3155]
MYTASVASERPARGSPAVLVLLLSLFNLLTAPLLLSLANVASTSAIRRLHLISAADKKRRVNLLTWFCACNWLNVSLLVWILISYAMRADVSMFAAKSDLSIFHESWLHSDAPIIGSGSCMSQRTASYSFKSAYDDVGTFWRLDLSEENMSDDDCGALI